VGDSEELAERIPGAELVVLPGAAHAVMAEQAGAFNRVMFDFLDRVREEGAEPRLDAFPKDLPAAGA